MEKILFIGCSGSGKSTLAVALGEKLGLPVVGGILLGVIEIVGKAYISTQLSDAVVFAVLIVVLLVKPSGLLGKTIREKV